MTVVTLGCKDSTSSHHHNVAESTPHNQFNCFSAGRTTYFSKLRPTERSLSVSTTSTPSPIVHSAKLELCCFGFLYFKTPVPGSCWGTPDEAIHVDKQQFWEVPPIR